MLCQQTCAAQQWDGTLMRHVSLQRILHIYGGSQPRETWGTAHSQLNSLSGINCSYPVGLEK